MAATNDNRGTRKRRRKPEPVAEPLTKADSAEVEEFVGYLRKLIDDHEATLELIRCDSPLWQQWGSGRPSRKMVRRSQAPARHPKRVPSAARSERPVETLARAAARDAWTAHGHQAPAYPSLPAWLALERMVAEAQLDGVTVGQGDRCSVLVDALLAKRDAWDELVSAARRVFLAAYRRELGALQVSTRPARVV